MVPGFVLGAALGRGGFSRVIAARPARGAPRGPSEVALKIARVPKDPRFRAEAAAVAMLGPPATPALLGQTSTTDQRPVLVLEHLPGPTLAAWLAARPGIGAVRPDVACALVGAIARAAATLHARGLVHRDLKPENIMLVAAGGATDVHPGGDVRLVDLGLACAPGAPASDDPGRPGTVHYMAPEQAQGGALSPASDVYALGVILFELLTGRPPMVGEPAVVRQAHVARRAPRPSAIDPALEPADAVLARCLAKAPADRFVDGAALSEALRALRDADWSGGAASPPDDPESPLPRPGAPDATPGAPARRHAALLIARFGVPITGVADAATRLGAEVVAVDGDRAALLFAPAATARLGLAEARRAALRLGREGLTRGAAMAWWAPSAEPDGPGGPVVIGDPLAPPPGAPCEAIQVDAPPNDGPASAPPITPRSADTPTRPGAGPAAPAGVGDVGSEPPLVGRDDLLRTLGARARVAPRPGIDVVIGDRGLGRTRLAVEVAARLASPGAGEVVLVTDAASSAVALARLAARPGQASAPGDSPEDSPSPSAPTANPSPADGVPLAAVIVDDAEHVAPALLETLTRTVLGGRAHPWTLLIGAPELADRLTALIDGGADIQVHELGPLALGAEEQLLGALLAPLEHVPAPTMARLCAATAGVPLFAVELVRMLRLRGALAPGAGGGWVLAGDDPLLVSGGPAAERLAVRALASLPPALVALAELVAIMADPIDLDRVGRMIQALVPPPGDADASALGDLDAAIGLERLVRRGLLRRSKSALIFSHGLVRSAIESRCPPARRRAVHAAALTVETARLAGRPSAAPELADDTARLLAAATAAQSGDAARLRAAARHAEGAGATTHARIIYTELAARAAADHDRLGAERDYSAALALTPPGEDDGRRARLLAGRGAVRYQHQRYRDALADLGAARDLVAQLGSDRETLAELLLEEAVVLDWLEDRAAAEAKVDAAALLVAAGPPPSDRLRGRLGFGQGRSAVRRGDLAAAATALADSISLAVRVGDEPTHLLALLLAAPVAVYQERLDDAAETFDAATALARRLGDEFHLAVALVNRSALLLARGDDAGAQASLADAIALARVVGNAALERAAAFNLAEIRLWRGEPATALPMARRARDLQARHFPEPPTAEEELLLGRLALERGDTDAARVHLDWVLAQVQAAQIPPHVRLLRDMCRLVLTPDADPQAWEVLLDEATKAELTDERLEILWHAVAYARARGDHDRAERWRHQAELRAADAPAWRRRFG